jgi:hypothetical protein
MQVFTPGRLDSLHICTVRLVRLLAGLSKNPRVSIEGILIMDQRDRRTRFATLDLHGALSGARQQSDEVDSVQYWCEALSRVTRVVTLVNQAQGRN